MFLVNQYPFSLFRCPRGYKTIENDAFSINQSINQSLFLLSPPIDFKQWCVLKTFANLRRRQRERQKPSTLHVHYTFWHISLPSLHDLDAKIPDGLMCIDCNKTVTINQSNGAEFRKRGSKRASLASVQSVSPQSQSPFIHSSHTVRIRMTDQRENTTVLHSTMYATEIFISTLPCMYLFKGIFSKRGKP